MRDQAVFLEPGQAWIDRAGRRCVDAHEPVLEKPDDLIAVSWRLIKQLQQIQPKPAAPKYRAHFTSPLAFAYRSHGRPRPRPPDRRLYQTRYVPPLESQ